MIKTCICYGIFFTRFSNSSTFISNAVRWVNRFSCGSLLYDIDPKREKYFINYDNVHPNALGQEYISELLYEKVKEHGSI